MPRRLIPWSPQELSRMKTILLRGGCPVNYKFPGRSRSSVATKATEMRIELEISYQGRRPWSGDERQRLITGWNAGHPVAHIMRTEFPERTSRSVYGEISRMKTEGIIEPRGQGRDGKGPKKHGHEERETMELYDAGAATMVHLMRGARFRDSEIAVSAGRLGRVFRPPQFIARETAMAQL